MSLNWLLFFFPVAVALKFIPGWQHDTALFAVSCLALIPMAGWMGRATEHLSHRMGEGVGGLLNASFGNAAELIIALIALHKGLVDVVKASITGSIIGNLLLVLGLSLFCGGLKFRQQRFNKTAVRASCTMLILAALALLVPSIFHHASGAQWSLNDEHKLSLGIALILFASYGAMLWFSLVSHKTLFVGEGGGEDHGEAPWSTSKAAGVLVTATVGVAILSEFLVGAVEGARHTLGLTEVFVGVVIVAIVGNAAEHSTAILMALKNKMDLSLGIAIGSSVQIALFVAPLLVFASYAMGHPMHLEFTIPEVVAVAGAVYITDHISGDGESNWLEGILLLAVYAILGVLFFYLPEAAHAAGH